MWITIVSILFAVGFAQHHGDRRGMGMDEGRGGRFHGSAGFGGEGSDFPSPSAFLPADQQDESRFEGLPGAPPQQPPMNFPQPPPNSKPGFGGDQGPQQPLMNNQPPANQGPQGQPGFGGQQGPMNNEGPSRNAGFGGSEFPAPMIQPVPQPSPGFGAFQQLPSNSPQPQPKPVFNVCSSKEQWVGPCASRCEPSCAIPVPQICTADCFQGCQCHQGLFRQADGTCDTMDACNGNQGKGFKACGMNEEWVTCGTRCEPSCDNPNPQLCNFACFQGCQCLRGFLRQSDGSCGFQQQCFDNQENGADFGGDMGGNMGK
ncbi:unnamed protein product, partial [Mesorhabditis belari]|uniref:TIL domain-containing protein n=1 Tax=Mesorhabditis belari TaxID=2138241 RepID=A0AAF3EQT1_9BILA